jgi:hypothetical protein
MRGRFFHPHVLELRQRIVLLVRIIGLSGLWQRNLVDRRPVVDEHAAEARSRRKAPCSPQRSRSRMPFPDRDQ